MRILLVFSILACFVCHGQNLDIAIPLHFEKDLIPEGIAIDPISHKVYLNSLKSTKIVRSNLDGSDVEEFLKSHEHGYLSGFGMTIKDNTLYALGNGLSKENNTSILLLLDITSGELIQSYTLDNGSFVYLNDIAVDSKGTAYITDSESSSIYTINPNKNELEVFFSHDEVKHSNGIAISDDNRYLYLASYTSGIRILDIASQKLINQPNSFKGIDGMKYYRNNLFAIVNGRRDLTQNGVFQFKLNENSSEIISDTKIAAFEHASDIPTTFAIYDGHMYFVADSQLDNFNQENNTIIHPDQLENYRLVRLKIPL
ncbi:SMP-30/gluconolactonase/LRE family protein [Muricauda sp. CAU 1633]|uniref:SMP-30/gluconolactonase/LRE family protein n=1 Tax=Allomuricauda sp. CAU 1633 TaxID=2816036 RepID=UPI001A8F397B|nr:SMP-30/gluconolactonase/LRE family protein [Muricauda sp. CAU 1633]MBO0320846.1 SMP-30/gluconolactonase/LRE family protein [Muricauda sp. CAU 1633]